MKILFTENGWDDYLYWHQTDRRLQQQINKLIEAITRDPFQGIGKPEPLKHQLTGSWSRRINQEHRLIYRVIDDTIEIVQCRYHY